MVRLEALTAEQNRLLTQTGPGTPGGVFMRSYWQPVALSSEMVPGTPPKPIKILGEELVLFRDARQRLGLVGRYCPHRGVDLSYARLEDDGLRCIYHGWLIGADGRCLDQPGQPPGTSYASEVKHRGYPCLEIAEVIFAYLGDGTPPPMPLYDALRAPVEHISVSKYYYESNYLFDQESDVDPGHVSFLHIEFPESEHSGKYGPRLKMGITGTELSANAHYVMDSAPIIELEHKDYGLRVTAIRKAGSEKQFVRGFEFIYPNVVSSPIVANGYLLMYHVPIDDHQHWRFDITFDRQAPIDKEAARKRREATRLPDGRQKRNRTNRYQQDRGEMADWYAGMGSFSPDHDGYVLEETWPIEARTNEQLGSQDAAIVAMRELMLKGIQACRDGRTTPPATQLASNDQDLIAFSAVVSLTMTWQACWTEREKALRENALSK